VSDPSPSRAPGVGGLRFEDLPLAPERLPAPGTFRARDGSTVGEPRVARRVAAWLEAPEASAVRPESGGGAAARGS